MSRRNDLLKEIVGQHWPDVLRSNPRFNTLWHRRVVGNTLRCGDADRMGFAKYRCTRCGQTRLVSFTCKTQFCPTCAKRRALEWSEFIASRLLPGMRYRQVILTVPEELRVHCRNPKLLGELLRIAHRTLAEVFRKNTRRKDLEIGTIAVLHSQGRAGNLHLHVHVLVTLGGIGRDGRMYRSTVPSYPLFRKVWGEALLRMVSQNVDDLKIHATVEELRRRHPGGFFVRVENKEIGHGERRTARYISKYLGAPIISPNRIIYYDGKNVRYRYWDFTSNKVATRTMAARDFVAQMVEHILPKSFIRIRHAGLHSNRRYTIAREQITRRQASSQSAELPHRRRRIPYRALLLNLCGRDPLVCRECNNEMELEILWHPDLGFIRDRWEDLVEFIRTDEGFIVPRAPPGLAG
ncbi:MAG TPA: hypothetical protein DCX07_03670 [Phycisphaerales bacterium]|nr:hypothetical protein [Phycisphaerales bacterium]